MILRSKTLAAGPALVAIAYASQPGAIAPIPGPMRDLTWGQINFIHTTDTHGWIGGHFQECVLPNLFLGVQLTSQAPILCRLGRLHLFHQTYAQASR
jgi:2',3'-cyclic-nucleotide 2'-phosphodiesterase (5'-nucleotidase family)